MAALERDGKPHWSLTDFLLDDLRMWLTGSKKHPPKPHALRPRGRERTLNPKRLAAARRRRAERLAAIAAGEIT